METLTITYDQAPRIKELLTLFIGPGPLLVQEGSMKIEDVTLAWTKETIILTFKDPRVAAHSEEV